MIFYLKLKKSGGALHHRQVRLSLLLKWISVFD